MLGASFLPARWRSADGNAEHRKPSWFSKRLSPYLAGISKRATVHPIYTIVTVAVLASTTYLGLLESSLFERHTAALGAGGNVDFDSLLVGSKTLYTGADNGWSWSLAENGSEKQADDVGNDDHAAQQQRLTYYHRTLA
jgi:hydroxymethylglutaryl-CoA reductase (NADPH)